MRLAKKILLGMVLLVVSVVAVLAIAYNVWQDKIQSKVVSIINESIQGAVTINKMDYTLFLSYPNLVIDIDTLLLAEGAESVDLLGLYGLHLNIDAWQAWKGNYIIDAFSLKGGFANIINYKDSSVNLLNAVKFLGADELGNNDEPKDLKVKIDEILFSNIALTYNDELTNQSAYSTLESLSSQLNVEGDSLMAKLNFKYQLDSFLIGNQRVVKNQSFTYQSLLNADLATLLVEIEEGKIRLNLLEANIEGSYLGSENGLVDVSIWAKHTNLAELAKMEVFKEENLPEIKHGELEVDAVIQGYTIGQVPLIEASLKLKNLEVYNKYGKVIDKAGFGFRMTSLSTKDFNDSHIIVDSITINLTSGGYFRAKASIDHLTKPKFTVSWSASEQLENLDKLIKFPYVKSISGHITSAGNYSGTYNMATQTLTDYRGGYNVAFTNANIVLDQNDYSIKNINGAVYMINGDIGVESLRLIANSNKMVINGKIENAIPFIFSKPTKLISSLSIKSDSINTESLFAFNKVLSDSNKYSIREVDVNIQAELMSNALTNYKLIPTGKLTIYNFTALVDGAPPIAQFSGIIKADQKLVAFKDFSGIIGKSHVDFSLSVSNYNDYFQSELEKQLVVDVSLKSEQINVKDFFTINNKFVLPKSYEEEVLKEVAINTKVITTNFELQKPELLPEFELQVTGLQFRTLYTPVIFKDIFVFGLVKDNTVYVNSMFGKFGRSDVFMNAQFDNVVATKDTISRPIKSRVTFNSGVLDLNELVKLDDETETSNEVEESTSNPFADKFPITEFQLNIGELVYYDAVIKNLKGRINIEENNMIHMHEVSLQSGEYGSFLFDGDLDASSRHEAILKSTIEISDVDLSKLNVTYWQNGEEVKISDHFEGMINGKIIANVPVLQDFSFDLARLTGKVKVKMTNGALINYAPLEEMGNYFKNKDLAKVRFDTLKNTMIFNSGKILLPFMTLNTTLGTINVMGFQSLENDMEYDIQVPIKLVAGSALNSLFASNKGDDKKDDKIKKAGKGKYVTVHISGNQDGFKFKLGKKHVLTAPPGFKVD